MIENLTQSFPQPEETKYVLHRRFDRMGRLVGDNGMENLFRSHVMIIGLGGVGSWAAESLARSGVGKITLVDFDDICITNTNRQLHAMQGMVGRKKADAMKERLSKVNPQAKFESVPLFYSEENSEAILGLKPDYIIDAIDNLTAKAHLISTCRKLNIPVITSGGSAAKMDPTRIRVVDLTETIIDPLAATTRKILRQQYDFPRGKEKFNVPCVFSDELHTDPITLHYDKGEGFKCVCPQGQNNLHSCDHRPVIWGNASFVTGAFGLAAAAWVVRQIVGEQKQSMPKQCSEEDSQCQ